MHGRITWWIFKAYSAQLQLQFVGGSFLGSTFRPVHSNLFFLTKVWRYQRDNQETYVIPRPKEKDDKTKKTPQHQQRTGLNSGAPKGKAITVALVARVMPIYSLIFSRDNLNCLLIRFHTLDMTTVSQLNLSLQHIYGRHHDLVNNTEYLCHKWPRICYVCRNTISILSSFMTHHLFVISVTHTTGDTKGAETAYTSRALDFTLCFSGVHVPHS